MPVQIGGKAEHDFTQPLELLSDCHRRIERFLSVLARVAAHRQGGPLDPDHREALAGALRYFRDAAPKHTADEELSLFPRLRAVGGAEVAGLLAEIAALETDHSDASRLHQEADTLGLNWLRDGTLPIASAERLCVITEQLMALYQAHIQVEDTRVFPLAGRVLGANDRQAIGREMAARRTSAEAIRLNAASEQHGS